MISNHDATLLCHPKKRNKTLDGIRVILPRPVRDSFKTKKTKTKLHQGLGTWVNCLNPTIVSYSVIRLVRKCYRRLELVVLWFQTDKRPRRSQWLYERTHVELLPRGFCCCYHWLYSFSSVSGCSYGWFCVSVTNQPADEKELEVKHRLICAWLENTEKKKKRAVITTKGSTVYDPENVIAHVEFDA